MFKNYASILKDEYMAEQGQKSAAIAEKARYNYLQAVKIDPTDYSLWYYIGYLSQKLHKLRFARFAYETGFYMSDRKRVLKLPTVRPNDAMRIVNSGKFTVMQWRCLENLCQVLYDIGDYRLCAFYVDLALKRNAHWDAGLQLKQQLSDSSKPPSTDMDDWSTEAMETDRMDNQPITIHLEKSDWTLLIKSLLDQHKRLVYKDAASNNSSKKANGLNDAEAEKSKGDFFISHAIMIHVDDTEEKDEEKESEAVVDDASQQTSETAVAIPEPVVMLEKPVDQEQLPKEPTILLEKPVNAESNSTGVMDVDAIREPVVLVDRSEALSVQEAPVTVASTANTDSAQPIHQNTTVQQPAAPTTANEQPEIDPSEEPGRPKPIAISDLLSQSASVPLPLVPNPTAAEPVVIEHTPDISSDVEMTDAAHVVPLKRKREHDGDDDSASQTDTTHEKSSPAGERPENEEEDGEDEEEEEAEEKRLSLRYKAFYQKWIIYLNIAPPPPHFYRASKRQREKIANEESSRLKMLEEEELFTGKVRDFYDKLDRVPQLSPQAPWFNASAESFWEWFDRKISELDSTYCWDIDTVNNAM